MLYVDDILLTTSDLDLLYETKKFLTRNFKIIDMNEIIHIIGINVSRDGSQ